MNKFNVGDVVKTCDGREMVVLKTDAPGERPLVVMDTTTGDVFNRTINGLVGDGWTDHPYNLIPPKRTREVTVWVNVYSDFTATYNSEMEARETAVIKVALAVAVPCKLIVEW